MGWGLGHGGSGQPFLPRHSSTTMGDVCAWDTRPRGLMGRGGAAHGRRAPAVVQKIFLHSFERKTTGMWVSWTHGVVGVLNRAEERVVLV